MQSYLQFGSWQSGVTPPLSSQYRHWLAETLNVGMKTIMSLLLVVLINYILTWTGFIFNCWRISLPKSPATVPYLFPIIGSSFNFVWNPLYFIRTATLYRGIQVPVRVKVLGSEIFVVQGRDNVVSLFKQTTASTATYVHMFCLKNLFGMRSKPLSIYGADNSGDRSEPYSYSTIQPHNRINFLTHESLLKFFSGPSMTRLFQRFCHNLSDRITALHIGDDWEDIPDFLNFIQTELSTAVLEATMGPQLIAQNPTFVRDLFLYDSAIPTLSKGFPSFMNPGAYKIRAKMLLMIKRWHIYARENFDEDLIDPDGDFDPYWGSEHMRHRQKILRNVDGFDADALATSDLGLIWAIITNAVPCSFWAVIHICRDPVSLSRIREELRSSTYIVSPSNLSRSSSKIEWQMNLAKDNPTAEPQSPAASPPLSPHSNFEIESLLRKPFLRSIYAETLRLYVRGYITRCPERSDLQINDWIFPKNKVILVSSDPAHFNSQIWNTSNGRHPLETFWAERFLVRAGDDSSGPVRNAAGHNREGCVKPPRRQLEYELHSQPAPSAYAKTSVKFTMSGLYGSWIPYGGGSRACPGRHFAKREILNTCAMLLAAFDIEILADEEALKVGGGRYGLGAQKPAGKIPARIRKRR